MFTAWGVRALWQLDDTPVTSTFNEQMMHRKTRTMEQILDGLVRGDLRRVENSAEHMKSIGLHVNWYSSSEVHENNNELFRHNSVDLVVMGTVGRSGLTGLLMGNTSEEVLDQINCSVLAVKPYSFKTPIHVGSSSVLIFAVRRYPNCDNAWRHCDGTWETETAATGYVLGCCR